MSNDGFRLVIDQCGGKYYWEFTLKGEQFANQRGYSTAEEAALEASMYRRELQVRRYYKEKKAAAQG